MPTFVIRVRIIKRLEAFLLRVAEVGLTPPPPAERRRLAIAPEREQRRPIGGAGDVTPTTASASGVFLRDAGQRAQELGQQLQPLGLDTLGEGGLPWRRFISLGRRGS